MVEARERGRGAIDQHYRLALGLGGVRQGDRAVLVGLVEPLRHPDLRLRQGLAGLVQDGELLARRGEAADVRQPALLHQRPASLARADELDHVHAAPRKLRELKRAPHAPQRGLGVLVGLLLVGDQPVEIQRKRHRLANLLVVLQRVDAIDLHDQRLDVLDVHVQLDLLIRPEILGVGRREVQVHALGQGLVLGRGQHGRPLLGVARAGKKLRLSEDFLQVAVLDELGVGQPGVLLDEEVLEVRPDERLIAAADRRQEGLLLEARAHVGGETLEVLAALDRQRNVEHPPRQLEVLHEPPLVELAARAVERQAVIQHVGLERVEGRVQALDERPHPLQVRELFIRLLAPVDILAGAQAHQVRVDEVRVPLKGWLELQQSVELVLEQLIVNRHRAEAAAARVLLGQVLGDEPDQPFIVRAGEPLEVRPQLAQVHLAGLEPLQGRQLKAVQAVVAVGRPRALRERVPANQTGVQLRRQRALYGDLALVVEAQAQLVGEVLQRLVGVGLVAQQSLAVLNLDYLRACAVLAALEPLLDDGVDLLILSGRLVAEALVEVVIISAGDELLDGLVLVL